jgi:hypothetical protein
MGLKKKVIETASYADFHNLPQPIKKHIPDWYKQIPFYQDNANVLKTDSIKHQTVKQCMPFIDALTTGYVLELWCDILVTQGNDVAPNLQWRTNQDPLQTRNANTAITMPVPAGHYPQGFSWSMPYSLKTPKGYSAVFTHPLNRFDLPFTTLSGVVDSDNVVYAGNFPFFIKKEFEGVIKKGTPILQIIPFEREDWESRENKDLLEEGERARRKSMAVISGWYKHNVWQRKSYK